MVDGRIPTLIRTKTKFVIPNMITAASLVLGMLSIFYSYEGRYAAAGWLILFSTILDKLDGSTARALKASTEFGVQLDSFSDFIAFSIAPAILIWSLLTRHEAMGGMFNESGDKILLMATLIFLVLTAAMRLARFNVTTVPGGQYMIGLATTAVGGLLASFTLICINHIDSTLFGWHFSVSLLGMMPYFVLLLSLLMVSNFPMKKLGHRETKNGKIFELAALLMVFMLVLLRTLPELIFLAGFTTIVIGFGECYLKREEVKKVLRKEGVEIEDDDVIDTIIDEKEICEGGNDSDRT